MANKKKAPSIPADLKPKDRTVNYSQFQQDHKLPNKGDGDALFRLNVAHLAGQKLSPRQITDRLYRQTTCDLNTQIGNDDEQRFGIRRSTGWFKVFDKVCAELGIAVNG